jgi:hypothetical protein
LQNPAVATPRKHVEDLINDLVGPSPAPRFNDASIGDSPSSSIPTTPTLGSTLTPLPVVGRVSGGSRNSDAGSELTGAERCARIPLARTAKLT